MSNNIAAFTPQQAARVMDATRAHETYQSRTTPSMSGIPVRRPEGLPVGTDIGMIMQVVASRSWGADWLHVHSIYP